MAIYFVDKGNILAQAAAFARDTDRLMTRMQQFKAWMDTQQDSDLIAAGFIQGEVDTLRSAMTDLGKLVGVYQGTATQGTDYDFRTFAKQLYPFGSL